MRQTGSGLREPSARNSEILTYIVLHNVIPSSTKFTKTQKLVYTPWKSQYLQDMKM